MCSDAGLPPQIPPNLTLTRVTEGLSWQRCGKLILGNNLHRSGSLRFTRALQHHLTSQSPSGNSDVAPSGTGPRQALTHSHVAHVSWVFTANSPGVHTQPSSNSYVMIQNYLHNLVYSFVMFRLLQYWHGRIIWKPREIIHIKCLDKYNLCFDRH